MKFDIKMQFFGDRVVEQKQLSLQDLRFQLEDWFEHPEACTFDIEMVEGRPSDE